MCVCVRACVCVCVIQRFGSLFAYHAQVMCIIDHNLVMDSNLLLWPYTSLALLILCLMHHLLAPLPCPRHGSLMLVTYIFFSSPSWS